MRFVPYLVFAVLALLALAFVAVPLWRRKDLGKKPRLILLAVAALLVLGIGSGTYLVLGQPQLAFRAVQPADSRDVNGLIGLLVERVKKNPKDATAWAFLGRGYITANDPGDGAKALSRAIEVLRAQGQVDPSLYSAYGEALVEQEGGQVGPDAENAFATALAVNPRDAPARFFMGQARANRGDRQGALALWQSLLAEVPPDSRLHQILVDRVALLTGAGGAAPNIQMMVSGLADRLKNNPNDAAGWQRLIRAYSVLGDADKAKAALATARKTFAAQPTVTAALDAEAQELKIQ